VLAPERHVVHAAQDAAVRRLGEQDLLLPQIAERPRRQLLAAEFPPDEAGDQLARSTQSRCRHISLEDREQRRRVGQQQARAPIGPQQVRVPVLGIRRRRRLGGRRAQDSQELSRAPQDHCAIVRRGAASRRPGSSAPGAPAQGVASRPVRDNPISITERPCCLPREPPARPPAQVRHPGGTPIQGPFPPRRPAGVRRPG
jgi:hypothetical protein